MKPITSRIKRSPLFSYGESPAKQTAKGGSTTKTDDKEIIEKKEVRTQASKDFEAKCYNADGSRKRGVAGCTWADEEGTEATKETEIVETKKTIPGEEKDIEFDVMKMKSQGTMLEPYEVLRQRRMSDKTNKEVYKAQRKMAKYGSFSVGEDGKKTFTPNEGLSQKELRRLEQDKRE